MGWLGSHPVQLNYKEGGFTMNEDTNQDFAELKEFNDQRLDLILEGQQLLILMLNSIQPNYNYERWLTRVNEYVNDCNQYYLEKEFK
jgi:hypothetical protein